MFEQIFLSPQAQPSAIISNKHSVYVLPHESVGNRILAN